MNDAEIDAILSEADDWGADQPSLGRGWCPECGRFARIVQKGWGEYGYWQYTHCKTCGTCSDGA